MAVILRIIGLSLLTGGLGAGLAFALFGANRDGSGIALVALLLGCVGAVIGALAGAASEVVASLRGKPWV